MRNPPQEDEVARLLERCQRVDHYVPVREKLTLFESLSRMGGRLARSTEDLGRSSSNPSPRGKQRARSLHDLNRGRSVPVREMCRFFEKAQPEANNQIISNSPTNSPTKVVSPTPLPRTRFISDVPMDLARNKGFNLYDEFSRELHVLHNGKSPTTCSASPKNPDAPCLRMSSRRRHFVIRKVLFMPTRHFSCPLTAITITLSNSYCPVLNRATTSNPLNHNTYYIFRWHLVNVFFNCFYIIRQEISRN
ncbi:unnamed protein product [Trichogramma brassicae]|uniref:Uncharacterized protein n=1 Tax=Trichogramma brassicae TaxID=86971 RepID=A0A6H5IAL5_9HYME|nr:unnamed protein product [Trichogramma brassicae]